MGKVIAVLSGKGGTGKSTATAALGCALSELGHTVVCVDADTELRNLDLCLGLGDQALMDYGDVLDGVCTLDNALVPSAAYPLLRLLAAPQESAAGDLQALIRALREENDYVLVDYPGGLGAVLDEAAKFSDLIIMVATADPCAHRDAERTAQLLRERGCGEARLLMNRVNTRLLRQQEITLDDSIDQVGLRLIGFVPEDTRVTVALTQGVPLLQYAQNGRGAAAAFRRIAKRIDGQRVKLRYPALR